MTEATDNVDYLKSLYKAFANGDVPTVLAAFDDAIEWNEAEGNPYNTGQPYVGPAAVVEGVFARVLNDIEGFEIRPERFLGDGVGILRQRRGVDESVRREYNQRPALLVDPAEHGGLYERRQYVHFLADDQRGRRPGRGFRGADSTCRHRPHPGRDPDPVRIVAVDSSHQRPHRHPRSHRRDTRCSRGPEHEGHRRI